MPTQEQRAFFIPDVEMSESDGHVHISAEIPGVTEKDIDITLSPDGNTLSIRGQKTLEKEKQEQDYYCAERTYGEFRRTLAMPTAVKPDNVVAKFTNGVLEIDLTKSDPSSKGVKHIPIKTS